MWPMFSSVAAFAIAPRFLTARGDQRCVVPDVYHSLAKAVAGAYNQQHLLLLCDKSEPMKIAT